MVPEVSATGFLIFAHPGSIKVGVNLGEKKMDNEVVIFLISASVVILYLVFSAMTEMGTKLPWKK